jgi:ribose 5-phosphate isomerase A
MWSHARLSYNSSTEIHIAAGVSIEARSATARFFELKHGGAARAERTSGSHSLRLIKKARTHMNQPDPLKLAAAKSAVELVKDGMIVGLGTGSTSTLAVDEIGARVKQGLRIIGVPTSERTAAQARSLGIKIVTLEEEPALDLTIDGADQVEQSTLDLIKGYGGALLREKIVASAGQRLVIIVDTSKLVPKLGTNNAPVPVEIVAFGWKSTAQRVEGLGVKPILRMTPDGQPYLTDGGNFIVDCTFDSNGSAAALAEQLKHVVGVVEHGFFVGMASEVHIADPAGVRVLKR